MRRIWLLALLPAVLAACASGPNIVSNVSPGVDFRNFETYNFMQPLGTDRSGARTPLSSRLMESMNREMAARGLTRSDNPDLLIDFNVFTQERLDVRQTPTTHTVHRSHWHRGWSTWPTYQTTVRQYTEGSLLIDLIDPRAATLIAEGAATSRIRNQDLNQKDIDNVVAEVLNRIWAN
ncbi:MAG: DUF4136 domain-containing protein [Xanthomonadales bacterium]|nr:DUF4136 domain-containing protein [Xanthomonadales bacterium]